MDFLFDIPILGFILQFLVYLVNVIVNGHISPIILGLATPIALGALCGVMNERSGVVNIGIEGMMLFSAYVAFMTALFVHQAVPTEPSAFFGATPALVSGVIAAIAAGVLISLLHAWLSISIRADQIISGTIINITALGLTSYLNRLIKPFDSAGTFLTKWGTDGPDKSVSTDRNSGAEKERPVRDIVCAAYFGPIGKQCGPNGSKLL